MNGFLEKDEIGKILDGDSALLVEKARNVGEKMAAKDAEGKKGVSSSQLRSFFGTVKKLQMKARMEQSNKLGQDEVNTLVLVIPKLYYAVARSHRSGKDKIEKLRDDLEEMIKQVGDDKKKFFRFCDYLEAVLAYHKAFGGE